MRVYVVLFNPRTENEGIHSLRVGDRETILMFLEEDDAIRFAMMLEAQDFPPAAVESMDSEEIEEFCAEAGYEAKLIEAGELMMPPQTNLEETTWSPDGKPEPQATESSDIPDLDEVRRRLERLL